LPGGGAARRGAAIAPSALNDRPMSAGERGGTMNGGNVR
jgi:hypothetical protein